MNDVITFIFLGLALSLMVGGAVALAIGCRVKSKIVQWVACPLIALIIGFGIIGLASMEANHEADMWNDGFCPNCNIHWTPNGVYRNSHYYYCSNCLSEIVKH